MHNMYSNLAALLVHCHPEPGKRNTLP